MKSYHENLEVPVFSKPLVTAEALTLREKQVLQLVYEGFSNKEIGQRLGISYRTAEVHRCNAMLKMHLRNVVEVVRWIAGDPVSY